VRRLHLESLEDRLVLSVAAGESLPGQWITKFDGLAGSVVEQRSVLIQRMAAAGVQGVTVDQSLGLPGMFTLKTAQPLALDWMTSALQGVAGFQFVEADRVITSAAMPNDTSFGSLWGMHNTGQTIGGSTGTADVDIDAPEAWDISTGSSNVIVGVIDTGIDFTHPDLNDNIFVNPGEIPGNGIDDDANGFVDDWRGWDFYSNDNNPTDDNGHGTHVSGTIGAEGNNGIGVAGVNWDVTILPLKFLGSSGTGSVSAAISAVNYATMMRNRGFNIQVTNNSWGSGTYDAGLQAAIDAQRQAGILFVAAAGNGGSDNIGDNNDTWPNYPSNFPLDNILAVAAITNQNQRALFSNYGATTVDLAAPGQAVYSTVPSFVSASGYAYFDGTSMATPHVAGAAALLWSVAPTATYTQIRNAILQTVDPISSLSNITVSGGRLNVRRALEQLVAGPRVNGFSMNTDSNGAATSVTFTFTKAVDPLTFTTADIASFTGPGGIDLLTSVTGVTSLSATSFRVDFAPQPLAGGYAITIGPGINDLEGNPMDQDSDLTGGEVPGDRYTGTFSIAAPRVTSSTPTGSQAGPVSSITLTFSKAIDAASFTLADIASFTGPAGANLSSALTAITQVSPTQYRVDFTPQTAVGGYSLVVGPNILDLGGNAMDQDSDGTLAEPLQDRFTSSFSIAAPRVTSYTPTGSQTSAVSSMTFTFSKPIDAASFTTADVASFTGPGGANLLSEVTGVTSINATTFRVDFTAQKAAGSYSLVIGPEILDLAGNPLDQNFNSTPGEIPGDRYTGSFSITAPRVQSASPTGAQAGQVASVTFTFSKAIDVSTFTTADIASFTGPGGIDLLPTVTGIVAVDPTKIRVDFAPQGPAGMYKMLIGPNIQDTLGNPLDQDFDNIAGEATQDRYATTFSIVPPRIASSTPANGTSTNPSVVAGSISSILVIFNKAMDAASFTTADITFTGPDGVDLSSSITSITAESSTRFQINFTTVNAPGDYQLVIGPTILDLSGNPLDQDSDNFPGEALQDRYTLDFRLNIYGPDGYGYTALATPFQNIDLELGQPGVFQILNNQDDASVAVDLGSNTFNFYGTTYTGNNQLFVSTNGLVTFGTAYTGPGNDDLTYSPTPRTIAPYWDDLYPIANTTGQVVGRFEDLDGDSLPDRLIIEWNNVRSLGAFNTNGGTFQLILALNTGVRVSTFTFNYVDLDFGSTSYDNGASATTGIKDSGSQYSGPNRLLINYNNRTHPFIGGGKAIQWTAGGTIQGQVWQDANADGVHDAGERGLSGRTVYLDLDSDQTLDLGEPSALTGDDGTYAFTNLLPGSYIVRQLDRAGWLQTAPGEIFQSPLANSGFESGVFGPEWTTAGAAAIVNKVDGVVAPEGMWQATVSNFTSPVSVAALTAFLGRPETSLDTLIGGNVVEGSAIKRTVQASAGQVLSFQWNFFTDESVNSSSYNDFSFVSLVGPGGVNKLQVLASTFDSFVALPSSASFNRMTGYRTFSYVIPTTGTYTLAIGACDFAYSFTDSQIVIDDLQLTGGADSVGRLHRVGVQNAKTTISGKDFGSAPPNAPLNTPPTALTLSANLIAEHQPAGTAVGTFSTTDADTQDTFVYTLVSGAGSDDNGAFTISGNTLQTAASFNFEGKSSYSIRVRTTDAGGLSTEQTFTIQVADVNEAPVSLALGNDMLAENLASGATVGTLATGDPDAGDTFTYTLVSGVGSDDNGSFTISGDKLLAAASFDFEAKNTYTVRVRTTDAGGVGIERTFTIHVSNMNEAPTALALAGNSIAENLPAGTVIGDFSATDADANESFTYTLASGSGSDDNALFSIVGGQLKTAASFDFESKSSYSIRVRSTDAGGLWTEQTFTIHVSNVNEAPTAITLLWNAGSENIPAGTVIGDFSATDADANDSLTYTLVSGSGSDDNAMFSIVGGQLKTETTLDFEAKSRLSIRVRATDAGGLWREQAFNIQLVDINEPPIALELSNNTIVENAAVGSSIGSFSSVDPDAGDSCTYALVPGEGDADNAAFSIVAGQLVTAADVDFENQSSYSIRVRATDSGGLWIERVFTISVEDANDIPSAIELSNTLVEENASVGSIVAVFNTTDSDANDSFTYAFVAGLGDQDNSHFAISGNQLVTAAILDFENQNSYSIRIRATDAGGLSVERVFTISVGDANDPPTAIGLSNNVLDENVSAGSVVGEFNTNDVNDTFTYALVAGEGDADNGQFAIVGNQLVAAGSFDYEGKSSYSVRVRSTDAGGLWIEQTFTILVADVNEAPISLALSNNTLAENLASGFTVGSFSSTDPDSGDTVMYSLVSGEGSDDNGAFTLSGDTLVANASFNFEAKNSYSVRVRAVDGDGLLSEQVFTITVVDTNDAPVMNAAIQPALLPINEDNRNSYGTPIGVLLSGVTDPDAGAARGLAIIDATGTGDGVWQFTLDNGASWQPLEAVSLSAARLLPAIGNQVRIRFVPNANFHGTVSLGYVAWDQNQGPAGDTVDLSGAGSLGGVSSFSEVSRTSRLTIASVNDAPKLNTALSPSLTTIDEGSAKTWGTPVWMLLQGASDADAGAVKGLAITSAGGASNGVWQYTLDGGASWQALGAVSTSSARLLPAKGNLSRLRFVPNANFHGTVQLGFFAWDQTQGVAGGTWDVSQASSRGGAKAFSAAMETAGLTVNPVNNAPVITLAGSVGYTLNSPAILLASTATVKDPDSTNFAGGWLKVEITQGADASDRLSLGGLFKVVEGNLIWNNTATMGTLQGSVNSTALLVNLNASATLYRVEQLIRAIRFSTISSNNVAARTIAFSVHDGTNQSNLATMSVQVTS
jgi:hypothetical protein